MTPPRVLLIGEQLMTSRSGGLNRYLESLLEALQARGVSASALVMGRSDPSRRILGSGDPEAGVLRRLLSIRSAASTLHGTVDVVDGHFALHTLVPLRASRLRRLPLVVHFQGPWAEEGRVGRRESRAVGTVKRSIERSVYRRAEVVIVLSEAFRQLVIDRYGVDSSRVVVVPPGVQLDRFAPGSKAAARNAHGVDDAAFVAVAVRRLDRRMGLDVLVRAWRDVQVVHDRAVLLIAGDGTERAELDRLRRQLPCPDNVRLLGPVAEDRLADLYRAADVSVVPTRALEGFGLVTLESLACGTPAIVTNVGGLPDGVADLDPSLVVPAENVRALATRLLAAAAGGLPSSDECVRHAERFSWPDIAQVHVQLYERALDRPLRVAFLGHSGELSGGELALARLLPALHGVNATVVLAQHGPLVDRMTRLGIHVEVLPIGSVAGDLRRDEVGVGHTPASAVAETLRYTWRLRRRLRELQVDVVHTNTLKAALYGGVAGRIAGKPVVWHIRDRIATDYLPPAAVHLVRLASRILPSAVIANSETTLRTLGAARLTTARTRRVVPSPIDALTQAESPPASSGSIVVGLVGRLAPWKGQEFFLEAFAEAFRYEGSARARIVGGPLFGEDEYEAGLRRRAEQLGISDRVDFTGFVEDVASEYKQMDIVVHASLIPEPFGQVVVEAMAAGRPVIAADAGGPGEVVDHGVNGLLYPAGDVPALAEHMRRLASDSVLRRRIGEAGRERSADFSPEQIAPRVLDVYRRLSRGATGDAAAAASDSSADD